MRNVICLVVCLIGICVAQHAKSELKTKDLIHELRQLFTREHAAEEELKKHDPPSKKAQDSRKELEKHEPSSKKAQDSRKISGTLEKWPSVKSNADQIKGDTTRTFNNLKKKLLQKKKTFRDFLNTLAKEYLMKKEQFDEEVEALLKQYLNKRRSIEEDGHVRVVRNVNLKPPMGVQ